MIKNIIFDLGNVVVPCPNLEMVKQFFENENDAIIFNEYIFKSEFWKQIDLGQMTMLEVANQIREGNLVNVSNYDEVENFMTNWYSTRKANLEVIEVANQLKNIGYKIYILSNMAKETFEFLSSKYDFFNMVDGAIVSAFEGVKKPDKKIFDILLDRYSLVPEACLLIDDDDTNKTFETAIAMGIKGRRVKPNDVQDIKLLLNENGIKIERDEIC